MALEAGTRLGPYEIVAPLGAGGMGEVYRARDTRLERDVAVKILPPELADHPDRRARFEREAKAVAALSHPNILAIYDVGQAEPSSGSGPAVAYAVTELLDGETLREQLTQGPLPVRKAIDIATRVARGLAAAHDKGLVHRDLKPENVFLLGDGQVKILDFGLAKADASSTEPSASSPTALSPAAAATDPGTVMGTVGYMAPEQVRGQAVDARTDLFALGAVLFEMLTGQRAFQRETAAETMTAILREDPPDLTTSRAELSPGLERIVRHCLEKNPAERFQTARDVAFALEAFSGTHVSGISGVAPVLHDVPRRSWGRVAAFVVVAGLALAAGVAVGRLFFERPVAPISFETKTWDSEWITNARFGPDGQTIVFSAAIDGAIPRLFVIRPGTVTSQPLGEPATHLLSASSQGELAVLTGARPRGHRLFGGTLARMTMDGAPRPWMEDVSEADWSPDGSTLALVRIVKGRNQLEYPIGKTLYEVSGGYLSDLRVSPDGSMVAFFEHQSPGDDRGYVKVVDEQGTVRTLAGEYWGEEGLAWAPDSRAVYFSGSVHGGEALQPLVVNATGTPRVRQAIASAGAMQVQDVAADGRMLVMRDDIRASIRARLPGATEEREFGWLDFADPGFLSRSRKFLVFGDESQSAGANYAVAVRDLTTGGVSRIGEGYAQPPSPDDKWAPGVIPSTNELVLYPIGPGDPVKLARGPIVTYHDWVQWFPDGRRVLVCGAEASGAHRCYTQDVPAGAPTPVTPDGVRSALLSGDGEEVLLTMTDSSYALMPSAGGAPTPAKGLLPTDSPFAWTSDRQVVVASGDVPVTITKVDPVSGRRATVMTMAPPDRAGINGVSPIQWIDDGQGYVYVYFRELSKLFVVTGVGR